MSSVSRVKIVGVGRRIKCRPDGSPERLKDARDWGWLPLEEVLPREQDRTLFSVWRTYEAVPPFIGWAQWWDPAERHTVVLWPPALRLFLEDAFLLRDYATLKGRQPKIQSDYGIAKNFAPLRIALWAFKSWYAYPEALIKSSIRYVLEIAQRAEPTRFARGPHHLAFAFERPRTGKNIARARETAVSLMFPDVEDYDVQHDHFRPGEPPVPRTIDERFLRNLEHKIERVDERRREVIAVLRERSFAKASEVVAKASAADLTHARNWAHYVLTSGLLPVERSEPSSLSKRRHRKRGRRSFFDLFDDVTASSSAYTYRAMSVLHEPPTLREICRNLGAYIGLKLLAEEELRKSQRA